jgi:conjugative transfer signal peptidase TraF
MTPGGTVDSRKWLRSWRSNTHVERFLKALPPLTVMVGSLLGLKLTLTGHLLMNITPSIPRGLYWISAGTSPRRGDLVAFPIPEGVRELIYERHYLPRSVKLLAKPVAALAGDHVCMRDGQLVINGAVAGVVLPDDRQGLPVPHPVLCRQLADGELFAATAHANSFDSRNFGLIRVSEVRGTLTPLLTL